MSDTLEPVSVRGLVPNVWSLSESPGSLSITWPSSAALAGVGLALAASVAVAYGSGASVAVAVCVALLALLAVQGAAGVLHGLLARVFRIEVEIGPSERRARPVLGLLMGPWRRLPSGRAELREVPTPAVEIGSWWLPVRTLDAADRELLLTCLRAPVQEGPGWPSWTMPEPRRLRVAGLLLATVSVAGLTGALGFDAAVVDAVGVALVVATPGLLWAVIRR